MNNTLDIDKTKRRLIDNSIITDGGCWEWTRSFRGGYGTICIQGNHRSTHRVSYFVYKGPIPEGIFVCHKCDNKSCINPDHLFLGTRSDNMQDASKKGRLGLKNGKTRKLHKKAPYIPYNRKNTKEELLIVIDEINKNPTERMASVCRRLNFYYRAFLDYRAGVNKFNI